jgi:hypothetical protein
VAMRALAAPLQTDTLQSVLLGYLHMQPLARPDQRARQRACSERRLSSTACSRMSCIAPSRSRTMKRSRWPCARRPAR